jgi:hypothetical protein
MCSPRGGGERAEREKRLEDLAVHVLVAVHERNAAIADADRRAGEALREMKGCQYVRRSNGA